MIYTVTFNPALDYVVKVEHFALGSVNRTKTSFTEARASMFQRFWQTWDTGVRLWDSLPVLRAGR